MPTTNVKGGSLGYSVLAARYRQHFLVFNLILLALVTYVAVTNPAQLDPHKEDDDDANKAYAGALVFMLAIMAAWQYKMDGYAIKYLRISERKLFGKSKK